MERIMWKTAVPVLFCLTSSVHADIIFETRNDPQSDEENVLLNTGATGHTIFGQTNTSHISVQFTSAIDTLTAPSNGQARVEATDGLVNDVTVSVPGYNFQDFIGNPKGGSGTAKITVIANEAGGGTKPFTFSLNLGNGENFFTVIAENGESIASVTIDSSNGFSDLRQPRISGLAPDDINPHLATPEPATFTIVFGLAAVVCGARFRRFGSLRRRQ
jgi:hypothetical protein